ncbi:juvenile hormone esterase-like isoform X2 [Trichoplusia ni]|nr:juvenile hormone esterase-like isoform X2 [Trichoplusia ni]XP_026734231.1 juvenile hormone esterase-like isoform X2 [Trichoplusia ni]XP_026734232.1 juvenile hormone esterase-like isoform X2 [Trichoplusia ni]
MAETPIVRVEQGQVQGRVVNGPSGKAFYNFQGIPYAKPPLGSLRFKAPQPPEPWEGIREATSEGNQSAQIDPQSGEYLGDENCLYLNIYTPNLDGAFLPVMVFIHGGGFRFGSSSSSVYGGDYLVEKDVVVVTLNYRCGVLGFLSLNTPEIPGNAGLKDIVQALRWIKSNIEHFGGNSGNITVFGESAGGAAVSLLTASPLTKNMISKAIVQSGTAVSNYVIQQTPIESAKTLAQALGCESSDPEEILDFLNATSARDLVTTQAKINPFDSFPEVPNLFTAVVEKEFPGVEAFITEPFIDLLTSGRVAEIPIMIGAVSLEFTTERRNEDLQVFIPKELNIERNSAEALAITEKIKELYFKGKKHTDVESLNEYFELFSDFAINIDTHRHIQNLVKVSNKPIYFYRFDYVGELNYAQKLVNSLGLNRATHMDELGYLFKNDLQQNVTPSNQDIKTRERMLRLWTNFAKSGNPTPDENHYLTVTWLPVTKDNLYYLNIGNELSLATNPDKEKMEFWDDLYSKHYRVWDQKSNTQVPEPKIVETVTESVSVVESSEFSESRTVIVTESSEIIESSEVTTETEVSTNEVVEDVAENNEGNVEVVEYNVEIVENNGKVAEESNEVDNAVHVVESPPSPVAEVTKNGDDHSVEINGDRPKPRLSNEIKMVTRSNGAPKDVIRANDPPEDDLPKNIGVNKFVNFFESLGGKK